MSSNTAVLIFAKAPIPGKTKTRLIPKYGGQNAAELHAAMVKHIVDTVEQWNKCDIQMWCAPDSSHDLFQGLENKYPLTLHIQEGQDLGQRMNNAFCYSLNNYQSVIVIGTDCPTINQQLLEQAYGKLQEGLDVAIAPAIDGGYVLLGLRDTQPELFTGISWGTSSVFKQTAQRLEQLNLSWYRLSDQWDVDRPEDVIRLKNWLDKNELYPDLELILDSL